MMNAVAIATRPCMITDMSRKGLAMVSPYPFFAGVLAGFAAGAAANGPFRAISALIENRNVFTVWFFSSGFASLILTFWKYPERVSAVLKVGTELRQTA